MTLRKDNRIERVLRFLIAFVVVVSLAIPVISPSVFASSALSISGGDDVKGGDTFNVAVTFSGGDVGRVDAQLTYDTDQLTYISGGTSNGNTGYIQLKSAGTEGAIVFNIKFQAIADGSAEITVTTNEMYDFDEMPMDTPSATKVINIQGNVEEEEKITEPADEEVPVEETTLTGVDEMPSDFNDVLNDEDSKEGNLTRNIIIGAVIVVLLIVVISVIVSNSAKRKRRRNRSKRRR